MSRTAAALIIGNEILTGKVREANVEFMAQQLFSMGIVLRRVVVVPDEIELIAADLNLLRANHDLVFTSGGVGPTLDDVTLPGVARAFEQPLVRSEKIETIMRNYWGDELREAQLRMADLPRDAKLIEHDELPWPIISVSNVFVLPGIPKMFQLKMRLLRDVIGSDKPFVSRAIYLTCGEGEIAHVLDAIDQAHPDVAVGSYPTWRHPDYRVRLTFDGQDPAAVDAAVDAGLAALPADKVVKVT